MEQFYQRRRARGDAFVDASTSHVEDSPPRRTHSRVWVRLPDTRRVGFATDTTYASVVRVSAVRHSARRAHTGHQLAPWTERGLFVALGGGELYSEAMMQTESSEEGKVLPAARHTVGKYRILAELGHGGMSNVSLAVANGPSGVNKLVVLKALLPHLARDPDALAMFIDEARLGTRLNHPNVVQTYEVGQEGEHFVIVMEYLEGQSLFSVIQKAKRGKEPLPIPIHLRIIANALDGLHYVHDLADYDGSPLMLVHRDISPHNVFVTFDGQVKVLDFGIAKAVSSSTHTETGVLKGKISYMSPEQMSGTDTDRRADLYAVGAMLWGAAAGEKLWKNVSDVTIMRRVLNGEIPSPRTLNPDVDDELERITMKALACAPADRYPTALELQADLDKLLERMGPPIKQKRIGAIVSELFQENRTAVRALIERQLSRASAADFQPVDMAVAGELVSTGTSSSSRSHEGTVAIAGAVSSDTATDRARRASRWPIVALLAVGAVAGLLFIRMRTSDDKATAAAPVPTVEPTPTVEAPKPLPKIEMQFAATPADAKLFLDDEPLTGNPVTRSVTADGSSHRLRAEARGHVTQSTEVSWLKGERVALALEKEARAGGRRPVSAAQPKSTGTASNARKPGETPAANCDDPFVLDAQGIKRLKRECL